VVKFEKTDEETMKSFRKEMRARERWSAEENEMILSCPDASYEQRQAFRKERAKHFYNEKGENA